jgi:hypothetical protein
MTTNFTEKNRTYYSCELCDFISCDKKDYGRHILTAKHVSRVVIQQNTTVLQPFLRKKPHRGSFTCECGKTYAYRASLYNHKKKCTNDAANDDANSESDTPNNEMVLHDNITDDPKTYKELVIKLLEEHAKKDALNEKLTGIIEEQNKQISNLIPKVGNGNNTYIQNNKFNIQIFLNEKCKDAISMNDFIKSIDVTIPNLLTTLDKGLPDGITNIFIENINKLPLCERPLHCTDPKRETLYIKNDTWEKDDDKTKIKDAIKQVSMKQTKNVQKWNDANPDFMEDPKLQETFIKLVQAATGDVTTKNDKIINNLCKKVYINEKTVIEECG